MHAKEMLLADAGFGVERRRVKGRASWSADQENALAHESSMYGKSAEGEA